MLSRVDHIASITVAIDCVKILTATNVPKVPHAFVLLTVVAADAPSLVVIKERGTSFSAQLMVVANVAPTTDVPSRL
jgi:hypothetical protein